MHNAEMIASATRIKTLVDEYLDLAKTKQDAYTDMALNNLLDEAFKLHVLNEERTDFKYSIYAGNALAAADILGVSLSLKQATDIYMQNKDEITTWNVKDYYDAVKDYTKG